MHKHQVDSNPEEILTQNTYNDLSQITSKKVGGVSVAAPLQSIDYAYNIRGWMTQINDPQNLGSDLFGYKINYTVVEGIETPNLDFPGLKVKPKFNGNIAETVWKTSTVPGDHLRRYGYVYDGLNRLLAGFYQKDTNPNAKEYFEKMDYDLNGNITNLKRSAYVDQGNSAGIIDILAYAYTGNRLNTVTDSSTDYRGYPDTSGSLIGYDDNGNINHYEDKGILNITYNYLNLPSNIIFYKALYTRLGVKRENTSYLYRADGIKLRKTYNYAPFNPSGTVTQLKTKTTEYLDGFQYESGEGPKGQVTAMALKFIPTAEGYYNFENNKYIYNYTDHLGNVRLSYFNNGNNLEVLEESNYYPFGMKHEGYNVLAGNPAYKYGYNGKELQSESGMYDYGARFYMADIGRWGVQDPLSEKFFDFNNYNYVLNNPIKFVDKDGMDVYLLSEEGKFILAKKQKGDDLVYGYNSKTGSINDNNGDKKGDYKDGIRIKTEGLVGQLQYYRDGVKDDTYSAYHQSIKEYSSQVEDDMFKLFHYAASNAKNVEFSLIDFNLKNKRYLALQTYNDPGFSPGSGQIGKDVKTNAEYHYHPFKTVYEENYTEINSMGSRGTGIYYGSGGDYRNTVDYNVYYPNYVFFPKSTNLYNVTKTGIYLIKKINNNYKNFKK